MEQDPGSFEQLSRDKKLTAIQTGSFTELHDFHDELMQAETTNYAWTVFGAALCCTTGAVISYTALKTSIELPTQASTADMIHETLPMLSRGGFSMICSGIASAIGFRRYRQARTDISVVSNEISRRATESAQYDANQLTR